MSLYSQLFDEDENADKLLDILKAERDWFGRFRDIHVNANGEYIYVLTRCGGPNRDMYAKEWHDIQSHPQYLKDYDDEYDNTYACIEFKTPEDSLEFTKSISTGSNPLTLQELFEKEMKEMDIPGSDAEKRAKKIAEQIQKGMNENPDGGIIWM